MSDLIDRDKAIEAIDEVRDLISVNAYCAITERLKALPSAEPEIIRCKDCKYVGTDATCCLVCDRVGMGLKPYHVYHDDYCSYAERRDTE